MAPRNQVMSKCRERSSKPARRVIRTSLPSHAASNSARVMSEGRGDDGDCTSTLSSPALARKRNPPSLSAAIAGSGVLARRGHVLVVARALSPSSFPSRSISAMPTGEPPKRWRICSGSAPMPLKRSSVTSTTSPGSAGFKFAVCVNISPSDTISSARAVRVGGTMQLSCSAGCDRDHKVSYLI